MPSRTLSPAASQSATAEETPEVWLMLVTIDHDDLDAPLRIVDNIENITSRGNTYIACPVDIELPGDDPDGPTDARIRIDNVDRAIVTAARLITAPPTVTIEGILASDPDNPDQTFSGLKLRNAQWDAGVVQGSLQMEDLTVEAVAEEITPGRFPGLFAILAALPLLAEFVR